MAILIIASTRSPVYVHYIETYWARVIRRTNVDHPHVGVFLLFEHDVELDRFSHLANNVIQDPTADYDRFCPTEHQMPGTPGILLKTVYALELLQNRYDVFFRTNLSSMLKLSAFDRFVQAKDDLRYSSPSVGTLRKQLVQEGLVGPKRRIRSLDELDGYEGNSFGTGAGYFLSRAEAKSLVERKEHLRFDLVDDISVGLMFPLCECLPGFTKVVRANQETSDLKAEILKSQSIHFKLASFSPEQAGALWDEIGEHEVWK